MDDQHVVSLFTASMLAVCRPQKLCHSNTNMKCSKGVARAKIGLATACHLLSGLAMLRKHARAKVCGVHARPCV